MALVSRPTLCHPPCARQELLLWEKMWGRGALDTFLCCSAWCPAGIHVDSRTPCLGLYRQASRHLPAHRGDRALQAPWGPLSFHLSPQSRNPHGPLSSSMESWEPPPTCGVPVPRATEGGGTQPPSQTQPVPLCPPHQRPHMQLAARWLIPAAACLPLLPSYGLDGIALSPQVKSITAPQRADLLPFPTSCFASPSECQ